MLCLLLPLLFNAAPPEAAPPTGACAGLVTRTGVAMGTEVTIRVCPRPGHDATAAAERAFDTFGRLERLWSTWVASSDISRLNAAAGGPPVRVAAETLAVLTQALDGSRRTRGLFDVTFAPLGELWRFDTPPGAHEPTRLQRVPTADEIRERLARVGFEHLRLDPKAGTAQLARARMAVHLGGIGKGAAVDGAVALLARMGFTSFAVQAGGDLYCAGKNGTRPWRVGIAHPRRAGTVVGAVDVTDAAFSTSGDYERYAILDGVRYHHLLDTRTGRPATASQSATVLARSATEAEILTKAAFILGAAEGVRFVESQGAKAVVVDAMGEVHWSPGLRPSR